MAGEKSFKPNIIRNHDFSMGLHDWHSNADSCHASAETTSDHAVLTNREHWWQGLEQDITARVSPCFTYFVSASVSVSGSTLEGSADVLATLKLEYHHSTTSYFHIGKTSASKERWEKLQGTFSLLEMPDRVAFYLEGPAPGVDLLIRSAVITCSESENKSIACINGGGEDIIVNQKFEDCLNNWCGRGCKIVLHDYRADEKIIPLFGKVFASATQRAHTWHGIQQEITGKVQPNLNLAYEATALVRISGENVTTARVQATLHIITPNQGDQYICIANVQATNKYWVQLQGKFLLNCSSEARVIIFLEGPAPGVDILVNGFVLKHAGKIPPSPAPVVIERHSYSSNNDESIKIKLENVMTLSEDVPRGAGPWGGSKGKPWDDGIFSAVEQVHVHVGNGMVHAVQFLYQASDGKSIWSKRHGGRGGDTIIRIKLDAASEYLVGLMGFYGPVPGKEGYEAICSLTLYTNKGKYGPIGEEIGTSFNSALSDGKVVGFHGRSGAFLDALGVHMEYF